MKQCTKCKEYNLLYSYQDGNCMICGEQFNILCVDHNHETGEVRGLLCQQCNLIIGNSKENPEILEKSINYLRRELGVR